MYTNLANEFLIYVEKISSLINEGKLPKRGVFPRIAYIGHEVLNTYESSVGLFRCIVCKDEWWDDINCSYSYNVCNHGHSNYFKINHSHLAKWKCKACRHVWISEIGIYCPECHVPYWDC